MENYLYKVLVLVLLFTGVAFNSFGQTGTIVGTLKDTASNETIIGAVINVEGQNVGASSDLDGNFEIKIAPGTYTLTIAYLGYKTEVVPNVKVNESQETKVDVALLPDLENTLSEVMVVARKITNTEAAVVEEIKNADNVVVGISAEQISKSQDRDASQVMQRIPGVTIIDNRFVMVRGLSDRYNAVLLNNALAPSTEVDVKSFSFDVIPSSMIDRLLIYKSGAPELPGEFAGAAIRVYTKSIPDENITSVGFSMSARPGTTLRNFKYNPGSKTDFLGYDKNLRPLPSEFPAKVPNDVNDGSINEVSQSLPNNWTIKNSTALPDLRFNFNLSRRMFLKGIKIGTITSLNYSNTRQFVKIERNKYSGYNFDKETISRENIYEDDQYSSNARIGIIHNWAFQINPNHKIEFKNLFNQLGNQVTVLRNEIDSVNLYERKNYALSYENRSIYSGQLQGFHEFNNSKTEINWVVGKSITKRNEPDFRRVRTQRELGTTDNFRVVIPVGPSNTDAARFYSDLNEKAIMSAANLTQDINIDTTNVKLKLGYYVENKERDFSARWMSYTAARRINPEILDLPYDQIFAPENIDVKNGLRLQEGTNSSDEYKASNFIFASYVGISLPLKKFNVSGGLRMEYNKQHIESSLYGRGPVTITNPIWSPLPSVNVSYNITDKMLVRMAYFKSLNRPEFRELAPFSYYDFNFNVNVEGNPYLMTPRIHNLDFRWELYPSQSEFISFGTFYKRFNNPIEKYIIVGTSNPIFTFFNAEFATSYGAELEIRKSLYDFKNAHAFKNISLLLNASIIKSEVQLGDSIVGQEQKRPMQGQSPYIVNGGLYYNNPDIKLQVSVLYNVFGKRIFTVGNYATPTIYEMPRNILDLTITYGIGKHLEIRAGIQDILNQEIRLVQDNNLDSEINKKDSDILKYKRGSYYTAGLVFKL